MEKDLLGRTLTDTEAELARVYRELKALACMWQVVNDLDLEFEQLYDLGV